MSNEFYAGQPDYISKLNSLWDRATTSVFGTSTDSLSLTVGSKSFTTNPYLQFANGSQVTLTATSDLSKNMSGQVSAYDQTTGAITTIINSVNGGSGTFASWSLTLSGAAGATGIADSLSIGTVNTGTAAATITGTSPNKFLNLTLQTGATGASNVLSIGTVNTGTAAATITGTSPSQVLNLTLPTAPPNTLTIGTVSSGTAAASITGTSPNQVLNLTLQQGATGAKGVNPRGAWDSGTAYAVDDLSTYNGTTYIRLVAGTTATAPSSDGTNWAVFAAKGADGAGTVAGVTASAPLASTGGANPDISITQATTSTSGYVSSTDWNTFNGKASLISPSFTTPTLGVASATSINKVSITAPTTSANITIADGKTFTASNTLTFTGTDSSTLNVGTGGTLGSAAYTASTSYAPAAGSASVTTLGTVTTGTWNGSIITGAYGGTGVANTGKTVTLGGNLTTSGAFTATFTMTANTAVTFPVSGTLSTLTGTETLTNKTLTSPLINTPTGIVKGDVGLSSVDNTSDVNKPVSTATQTALNLKADKGANTFTADQNLGNNKLTNIKVATFNAEYNAGNSSTAITIDWNNGQNQVVTLTASCNITTSTPSGVGHYQLRIKQDATGNRVPSFVSLSASRYLGSVSTPAINLPANTETLLNIFYDGTSITQSLVKVGAV